MVLRLKRKCRHFDEFFITGSGSCHLGINQFDISEEYRYFRILIECGWNFLHLDPYPKSVEATYSDDIMSALASQITGASMVCSTDCSGADQRKHQSSASLAFVRGIHRWPVNSPHKGPVTREMFPFHNVIMATYNPSHIIRRCLVYSFSFGAKLALNEKL